MGGRNASKTFRPCSLAVALMVAKAACVWAPHSDRKPLVTLRWITEGRKARSQALLSGGTPLSGVGFLSCKEYLRIPSQCVILAGLRPRLRHEAPQREAALIEERYQDSDPPLAKPTD